MPTAFTATQNYDATPRQVFELFCDRGFIEARLEASGGINPEVVSLDGTDTTLDLVTRQGIPAAVLPSAVSSFISGDPSTQRTENWRADGDGYTADLKVSIHGAPASMKGTITLRPAGAGAVLTIAANAVVGIPLFGGKIEKVIVEEVGRLFALEERFTQEQLAAE